jgi:hypothetical protein
VAAAGWTRSAPSCQRHRGRWLHLPHMTPRELQRAALHRRGTRQRRDRRGVSACRRRRCATTSAAPTPSSGWTGRARVDRDGSRSRPRRVHEVNGSFTPTGERSRTTPGAGARVAPWFDPD